MHILPKISHIEIKKSQYWLLDHQISYSGNFNWKTMYCRPLSLCFPSAWYSPSTLLLASLPWPLCLTNLLLRIDGFQECLHCQYTHPSFSKLYPPTTYAVSNHSNYSQHLADATKRSVSDGLFLYFFPVCTLNVYGGGMSSFRTCPSEIPGVARMEFDYYHNGTEAEFEA